MHTCNTIELKGMSEDDLLRFEEGLNCRVRPYKDKSTNGAVTEQIII